MQVRVGVLLAEVPAGLHGAERARAADERGQPREALRVALAGVVALVIGFGKEPDPAKRCTGASHHTCFSRQAAVVENAGDPVRVSYDDGLHSTKLYLGTPSPGSSLDLIGKGLLLKVDESLINDIVRQLIGTLSYRSREQFVRLLFPALHLNDRCCYARCADGAQLEILEMDIDGKPATPAELRARFGAPVLGLDAASQ